MITAKDGGSMLRLDRLAEAVTIHKHLMNTYDVSLEDGVVFHYNELCEPYCNVNRPLEVFYVSFLNECSLKNKNSFSKES
jgi:hypothetical protein